MDLSIIIVNYNTHEYLEKCLNSILNFLINNKFEILVVDNNSPDRRIEGLKIKFPEISFFFLDENKGFGAGCNYAAARSAGKYLLFINPDIEFTNDPVSSMIRFMEDNENAGACSGLLLDEENKPSYNFNDFPDYSWELKNAYGIGVDKAIKRLLANPNITGPGKKPFEVDWFHGAFLLIKKNIFDMVNGFDEKIFLYYEDVDIQKKIKDLNYKVYCLPLESVRHFTQSSVRTKEGRKVYYYYMHLNKLYYMNKHFGLFKRIFIRINYIAGYVIRIILLPFRKKFRGRLMEKSGHYFLILKLYLFRYNY